MKSKTDQVSDALARGDEIAALRIAARFFDRSQDTLVYKRGWDAYQHPGFYRQLGHDPNQVTAKAVALLRAKFGVG